MLIKVNGARCRFDVKTSYLPATILDVIERVKQVSTLVHRPPLSLLNQFIGYTIDDFR